MSDADRLSKMKQLTSDLKSTASALKSTAAELELIAESMRLSWQERERLRVWAKDSEDARLGAAALEEFKRSGEASIPLEQIMRDISG